MYPTSAVLLFNTCRTLPSLVSTTYTCPSIELTKAGTLADTNAPVTRKIIALANSKTDIFNNIRPRIIPFTTMHPGH